MSYDFGNGWIVTEVKNPQWVGNNAIDVEVNHPFYGWMPFTATPDDVMDYGREIYADCLAGKFGPIKAAVIEPIQADDGSNP